jgi:hypothetical protein
MSAHQRRYLRLIDVCAGLSSPIMHFAQKIHGFYAGIENDTIRSQSFAESFKFSLRTTTKLVYMYEDLNNVSIYDFDIIYSFDKVFTVNDWRKLKETCLASR